MSFFALQKQLPADNLYRMYLEERLTREPDAISEGALWLSDLFPMH